MNDVKILLKAMKKAEKNGYKNNTFSYSLDSYEGCIYELKKDIFTIRFRNDRYPLYCVHINHILFDHEFCKAFFGIFLWIPEIQSLALQEDRIKYLEQFLKE